ncbi:hypothetical protein D1872_239220 [compost metagenome]
MFLGYIMLILAYANRLGFNLDELSQRVLQTTSDGYCTAFSNIQIRKLFLCQLRSRIDAGSGFIDN